MLNNRIQNLAKSMLFLPALLAATASSAQLITDNTVTPEQALLDYLLGDGVEVSNITFSGDLNQIGSFDASATNIDIPDGIVLATGNVDVAIGPNNGGNVSLGGGNLGAGDDDLTETRSTPTMPPSRIRLRPIGDSPAQLHLRFRRVQ